MYGAVHRLAQRRAHQILPQRGIIDVLRPLRPELLRVYRFDLVLAFDAATMILVVPASY
jgi:hypothetical protein